MSHTFTSRVHITGEVAERFGEILTPAALDFVARLDNAFAGRRRELLDARRLRREELAGSADPHEVFGFRHESRWIRNDSSWHVAAPASGLEDRRVEIVSAPSDRDAALDALNSGARSWIADLGEGTSPTWRNVIGGQLTLFDAIRRDLTSAWDTRRTIGDQPATIVVRPRGWHMVEKHLRIDGRPVSASLVDFGLYFFHNARQLLARGSGPYFCLPGLESHLEARLWNDVFLLAQQEIGIPRGSVRATVPIETVPAAFEMEEILYELREHAAGLDLARPGYLFSAIKTFGELGADYVLPDSDQVTMDAPFLRAYTDLLVRTCHRRGAQAMGGVSSSDPASVRVEKERETVAGFDGSRVADPALVPLCEEVFDDVLGGWPDQRGKLREDVVVSAEDLLNLASTGGEVTENGLRANIALALRYVDSWLRGTGTAVIAGSVADATSAETARCQVWQWVRNGTKLADGTAITPELVSEFLDEELASAEGDRLDDARAIFEETALGEKLPSFLTTGAYARYLTDLR
ncbi:malate synthase [Amycolatopsis pigmentata]|uniref:malate synthase n=1 Tax=Amycolatopsis pigmentata TaxID=450801 RepID=A0ABW5G1H5_9PSEU